MGEEEGRSPRGPSGKELALENLKLAEKSKINDLADYLKRLKGEGAIKFIVDMLRSYGVVVPIRNVIDMFIDSKKKVVILHSKYREIHIKYNGFTIEEIEVYGERLKEPQLLKIIVIR